MICAIFGESVCQGLRTEVLQSAMEELIKQGVDGFLVGNYGQFDAMARSCLHALRARYPDLQYSVLLAQQSGEENGEDPAIDGHSRLAVTQRNWWMIHWADCCLCYIDHSWDDAYKFAAMAKRSGLQVINLGSAVISDKKDTL